jgi:hypothetical protein
VNPPAPSPSPGGEARPGDDDKIRHDFKNQLAIIRGFAEILRAEAPPADPRRSDFDEIHRAAVAALDLLARLYPEEAGTHARHPGEPAIR